MNGPSSRHRWIAALAGIAAVGIAATLLHAILGPLVVIDLAALLGLGAWFLVLFCDGLSGCGRGEGSDSGMDTTGGAFVGQPGEDQPPR